MSFSLASIYSLLVYILLVLNALLIFMVGASFISQALSVKLASILFQLIWMPMAAIFSVKTEVTEIYIPHGVVRDGGAIKVPLSMRQCIFFLLSQHVHSPHMGFAWICYFFGYKLTTESTKRLLAPPAGTTESLMAELEKDPLTTSIIYIGGAVSLSYILHSILSGQTIFLLVTFIYFASTEGYIKKVLSAIMERVSLDFMEGLEASYVEGLALGLEIVLTFSVIIQLFISPHVLAPAIYFNVTVPCKTFFIEVIGKIRQETRILNSFVMATALQLREHNDVCAVCLLHMRSARVTPCNHLFHGKCLKLCLKEKAVCPMCNQTFEIRAN